MLLTSIVTIMYETQYETQCANCDLGACLHEVQWRHRNQHKTTTPYWRDT